jgi:hypothetical protein
MSVGLGAALLGLAVTASPGLAEDPYELAARAVLETIKAFRTAYVLNVVEHVGESGVRSKEDWLTDPHGIPLPAQFIKLAFAEIESFDVSLISLKPVYKSNLPRTQAEADALTQLTSEKDKKVITFLDGQQFKAMSLDRAIVQSCVDCHNAHPMSPWREYKRGDVMGGLIVRMNKRDK